MEKTTEKIRINENFLSAKGPAIKTDIAKNKDKNNGIKIIVNGIKP